MAVLVPGRVRSKIAKPDWSTSLPVAAGFAPPARTSGRPVLTADVARALKTRGTLGKVVPVPSCSRPVSPRREVRPYIPCSGAGIRKSCETSPFR